MKQLRSIKTKSICKKVSSCFYLFTFVSFLLHVRSSKLDHYIKKDLKNLF